MVLDITEEQFVRMRSALFDADGREALVLLKEFVKRLEQQKQAGLKSHLAG
jgi:hypothetical protein